MNLPDQGRTYKPRFDPEADAAEEVAAALGWPFVDLESYEVSCGILRKVSAELACRVRCVPMIFNCHRIVVVVDDPFQGAYLAANAELLGCPRPADLEIAFSTRRGVDAALRRRLTLVND